MTDEKLDQILKQALTPEIDDSEIQVRRKGRKRRMTRKTVVASGLVACAVVAFVVTGGYFGIFSKSEGGRTTIAGLERSDAGTTGCLQALALKKNRKAVHSAAFREENRRRFP